MSQIPTIDYLLIGAITRDLLPAGGALPGGTVRYAAEAALRLGARPGIVTCCHPACDPQLSPGIALLRLPDAASMTFENRYGPAGRSQWLYAQPAPLRLEAVPPAWRLAPLVQLAPLGGELPQLAPAWARGLLALTPQGWLRHVDPQGRVSSQPWQPDPALLRRLDVVVLSEEDVAGAEDEARRYARGGPLVALTRAERGVTLFDRDGGALDVPALPAQPLDPTGAGDVFTAAFLLALREGQPPAEAARWGCAVAACSIEGAGTSALPDPAQARRRLISAAG